MLDDDHGDGVHNRMHILQLFYVADIGRLQRWDFGENKDIWDFDCQCLS